MKKFLVVFFTIAIVLSITLTTESLFAAKNDGQKNSQKDGQKDGQSLFINEIMASNSETIRDGDVDDPDNGSNGGAYSDWIELCNPGSKAINLKGYTLSDSKTTWTFTQGSVKANSYLLIWASAKDKVAKDGQFHTNFKLGTSGDTIVLKSSKGTVVDSVTYSNLKSDQSFGRISDGSSQYKVFTKSTPLTSNANGTTLTENTDSTTSSSNADTSNADDTTLVEEPTFSKPGGLYTQEFNLQLTSEDSQAVIYYTTDCSDPVPGANGTTKYNGSIRIKSRSGEENVLSMIKKISNDYQSPNGEVFKCTTLKAVVITKDGTKSKIATHSYFVDSEIKSRYSMPIISVVTEYNNLFNTNTGIYMSNNCEKTGEEWERPAHIEFFEKDGTLGFSQNIGLRLNGAYTKKFPQKSLRIYADGKYGDLGKIKYEIFPGLTKHGNGKTLKSFERLILRNSGNDWSYGFMRDEMSQSLVSHIKGLDTQAARPAIVFLDGEYWGIHYMRERFDKDYFKSHYNLDDDKVVITDITSTGSGASETKSDLDVYNNDVINYLKSNSITQQNTYNYIKTKIDIDNYINYYVAEIFCGNTDWPGNNMAVWRYKTDDGEYHPEAAYGQDGRWRWLLKDLDFGFGLYGKSSAHDTLQFATGEKSEGWANSSDATFLFRTLLQNKEFRNQFINCFADQLNTSFVSERVLSVISQLENVLSPEISEHSNRWQNMKNYSRWSNNVMSIKNFAKERPTYAKQFIIKKFSSNGVDGTADITLKTTSTKGHIKINTVDINSSTPSVTNPSSWTGDYFTGVPVTVTAVPQEGYSFDHWEGITGNSDTVTFTHTEDITITAVFK